MREKYIEQKLVREVKKRGGLCEKWNSGSSGWPQSDLFYYLMGNWVGGSGRRQERNQEFYRSTGMTS